MKLIFVLILTAFAALPARAEVNIQEVASPGGITAWLVEEHSIPFTALELRFRGGASLETPGKRGAINLMTGLPDQGGAAALAAMKARGAASTRLRKTKTSSWDSMTVQGTESS